MKITKRYRENGEEYVVIDMAKEFKKFLWKNRLLLWALSVDRPLTKKEIKNIRLFGRP